jgi:hypothetical protein
VSLGTGTGAPFRANARHATHTSACTYVQEAIPREEASLLSRLTTAIRR